MLRRFLAGGRRAAVCGTCMDDRGIPEAALVEGAHCSTLDELSAWSEEAETVLVFQRSAATCHRSAFIGVQRRPIFFITGYRRR
jgi:hypothetical protein